jgi:PTS system glucitol/sorbitol-specific IIA component
MSFLLKTWITAIGPEVIDLAAGGIIILFEDGAPPELAEVSILHRVEGKPSNTIPPVGSTIHIGDVSVKITGIASNAWEKLKDIGHVVITFNGSEQAEQSGQICASKVNIDDLFLALKVGTMISIR